MFLFVNLNVTLFPADMQFLRATSYLHVCYSGHMVRQFRLSVRPSVTRVDFIKTAEHIEILSLSDRPVIL